MLKHLDTRLACEKFKIQYHFKGNSVGSQNNSKYVTIRFLLFLVCVFYRWHNPWMGPIGKF